MSAKKEAPNVQQHVEGQTSETESLTNGKHGIPRFAGCQVQATGEAGRNAPLGAPALPDGATGGAAALPCLKSNNSIIPPSGFEFGGSFKDFKKQPETGNVKTLRVDSDGRQLIEAGGMQLWVGGLSTAEKKKSYALFENIMYLVKIHGIERLGFLTLTFKENITDFREAQRRFNSLASNMLRKWFVAHIVTVEPQARGSVHYHLIVVCKEDIRTGFRFDLFNSSQAEFRQNRYSKRFHELKAAYLETTSDYLQDMWREMRKVMASYGFGRTELLPIQSNAEGIASYVGKYLAKGSMYRGEQFKGARMVRYSRGWRRVSQNYSWVETGRKWRKTIAETAEHLACRDMVELNLKCGRYWAFKALSILKVYTDATGEEIAAILVFKGNST